MRHGPLVTPALLLVGLHTVNAIALGDGTGVLIQRQGDGLVIGYDTGSGAADSTGLGAQAFGGVVASDGLTQEPSFLSLATPPTGSEPLPVGENVYWDFLPLTVDGTTSNLMRWDGAGDFELTPVDDATLTLFDPTFNAATVSGEAAATPGLRVGTTSASSQLILHAHRLWYLIGDSADAPEGVYVTAIRVWMDGLKPSDPFFVALGTPGMTSAVDDAAIPWIEENSDSLILSGDYNFDGSVDGADYDLWAAQYGATTPQPVDVGEADGNRDGVIDTADYVVWRNAVAAERLSAAIPEPGSACLALAASAGLVWSHRDKAIGSSAKRS